MTHPHRMQCQPNAGGAGGRARTGSSRAKTISCGLDDGVQRDNRGCSGCERLRGTQVHPAFCTTPYRSKDHARRSGHTRAHGDGRLARVLRPMTRAPEGGSAAWINGGTRTYQLQKRPARQPLTDGPCTSRSVAGNPSSAPVQYTTVNGSFTGMVSPPGCSACGGRKTQGCVSETTSVIKLARQLRRAKAGLRTSKHEARQTSATGPPYIPKMDGHTVHPLPVT